MVPRAMKTLNLVEFMKAIEKDKSKNMMLSERLQL